MNPCWLHLERVNKETFGAAPYLLVNTFDCRWVILLLWWERIFLSKHDRIKLWGIIAQQNLNCLAIVSENNDIELLEKRFTIKSRVKQLLTLLLGIQWLYWVPSLVYQHRDIPKVVCHLQNVSSPLIGQSHTVLAFYWLRLRAGKTLYTIRHGFVFYPHELPFVWSLERN